jgi:predicted GNAT family N-acyltransferase
MPRCQQLELSGLSPISFASAEFEIRELCSVEELMAAYKLRYKVFADLGYLQHTNKSRLEIDPYDERAVLFGAFDAVSGAMIGTIRLITPQTQTHFARLVRCVLDHCHDDGLTAQAQGPRQDTFPTLATGRIERALVRFNSGGLPVLELSRIIVDPGLRGSGLARCLMECGIARAAIGGHAVVISSFLLSHLPMNARYGYVQLPDTDFERFNSVGQVAIAGVCRTDRLPEPTKSNVDKLLRAGGAKLVERANATDGGLLLRSGFQGIPGMTPGVTGG